MTTEREALDRIAALCDNADRLRHDSISTAAVRAVLAEVSPEPVGGVLDRDQARPGLLDRLLYGFSMNRDMDEIVDNALRFLETCVRPAAIDRDALRSIVLWVAANAPLTKFIDEATDRIVALVRPVAGVTLTPEEADDYVWACQKALRGSNLKPDRDRLRTLIARLEAAS